MTSEPWDMSLRVVGTNGEVFLPDFISSRSDDRIIVRSVLRTAHRALRQRDLLHLPAAGLRRRRRPRAPYPTGAEDAVATMSLIDDCYRAIGLEPPPDPPDT